MPHPDAATSYGACAAVKALYIANQLNITGAQRDEWASFFDRFQNTSRIWSNYSRGAYPGDFTTLQLATCWITDAFVLPIIIQICLLVGCKIYLLPHN